MNEPHEPRIGVHFPLAEFERRILADPDVLGMMYNGSLGRGEADRYSDLDISLSLRDEAFEKPGRIEHYLGWLGKIQFVSVSQHEAGFSSHAFVGADWQRVELDISRKIEAKPHPFFHRATLIKDTDGSLAALVKASGPPTAVPTLDGARQVIEDTIYHIGYVAMQNARGAYFQAVSNLCELAGNVYKLLTQLRGHEGWAERFVEQFLQPDELALLYAAWPARPERAAIRSAARGLWEWTRYVWMQAEQTLGEELGISLDVVAFLAEIERPYDLEPTDQREP
jgi:hypothetical protein